MDSKRVLTSEEISKIVDGFDPIDFQEMEMLAKLPPGNAGLLCAVKAKQFVLTFATNSKKIFPNSPCLKSI